MRLRGRVAVAGVSDPGRVRDHNEDAIGQDPDLGLLVLADGMGGLRAGEVAASMAVELVSRDVRSALDDGADDVDAAPEEEDGFGRGARALRHAIVEANATIHQVANAQPQCAGMGTTLVALLFHDDRLSVAHVGDSRVYRLRDGEIEQLTLDHSLVQELVDRGFYTRDEARSAPNRNVVTRALGVEEQVECALQEDAGRVGDVYLLCSDGLNDMLDDETIRELLWARRDDLEAAARALVEAANEAGGLDNVSVLLARIDRPFAGRGSWWQRLRSWFGRAPRGSTETP